MRVKRLKDACTLLAAAIATIGVTGTAIAQPTDQSTTTPQSSSTSTTAMLRITPFVAMGDDFAPGGGAAFTFGWTRTLSVEAEASLGRDAARSSIGLLYALPRVGRVAPYVAGGGGIQRDETNAFVSDANGFWEMRLKKTEFAVNVGAGVHIPVSDRWGYRADFRWYNPKAEWPESWRAYSGVTLGWWAPRQEP
jgi:hypothetical protein